MKPNPFHILNGIWVLTVTHDDESFDGMEGDVRNTSMYCILHWSISEYYFIEPVHRKSGNAPVFAIRAYTNFRLRCPEQIERYRYCNPANGRFIGRAYMQPFINSNEHTVHNIHQCGPCVSGLAGRYLITTNPIKAHVGFLLFPI